MLKRIVALSSDLVLMLIGGIVGSLLWAYYLPDAPAETGQCIPLYSSGQECCK